MRSRFYDHESIPSSKTKVLLWHDLSWAELRVSVAIALLFCHIIRMRKPKREDQDKSLPPLYSNGKLAMKQNQDLNQYK